MRLAIVNLTGGGLSGGYWKYLRNIVPLLAKDVRVTDMKIFLPAGNNDLSLGNIAIQSIPLYNALRKVSWLKSEMAKWKPDVVFIPTARGFECGGIPIVTMIRNMEPLVAPFHGNPLKECMKNIGRYMANLHACWRAHRVIAISKFVKSYLTEKWRIESDRIGLVYHGIDFTTQSSTDDYGAIASLKSFPFLFTAGSIRPARGLEDIIRAVAILKTEQHVQLAIGGNVDLGVEPYFLKLKKMANNLGISGRIHWTGKLNDSEMAWCFKTCEAFIMTSRVEACSNIALEAMSHGCVSIASANPPLPELFADSALYYPPKDFTTLAKHIQAVISMGQTQRAAMSGAAKNVASKFSWQICAQMTVNELQKALK